MRRIFVSLLLLSLFFMGYAHEPEFSTAGFFRLPDTGRDVYSMNPAWRFYKGSVVGAEAKEFDDKTWQVVSLLMVSSIFLLRLVVASIIRGKYGIVNTLLHPKH